MRLVPILAVLALAVLPATASAGEIWIDANNPNTVVFHAFPGETNTVDAHFAVFGHWVDLYDQTAPIVTTDTRCSIVHPWQARCLVPLDSGISLTDGAQLSADLGDDSDSFAPSSGTAPYRAIVQGGDGVDEITLGRNQAMLPSMAYGGGGNDIFHSAAQPGDTTNTFFGDAGDDTFVTLNGASDGVTCGDGTDSVRADSTDSVDSDCENVRR